MQNQTLSTPPRAANQPTPNVPPNLATAGRPLEQATMPAVAVVVLAVFAAQLPQQAAVDRLSLH